MPPNTFPAISTTRGRPLMGQGKRVPIAHCRVRPDTARTLAAWQTHLGCSQGLALDHLVDFAKSQNFVPPLSATSPKTKTPHHGR